MRSNCNCRAHVWHTNTSIKCQVILIHRLTKCSKLAAISRSVFLWVTSFTQVVPSWILSDLNWKQQNYFLRLKRLQGSDQLFSISENLNGDTTIHTSSSTTQELCLQPWPLVLLSVFWGITEDVSLKENNCYPSSITFLPQQRPLL